MPIQKLTKRVVDAITSGDKTVIYYDSELTGFCLKVLASGGKRWCVEYRSGAGGRSVGKTRMVLLDLKHDARSSTARWAPIRAPAPWISDLQLGLSHHLLERLEKVGDWLNPLAPPLAGLSPRP